MKNSFGNSIIITIFGESHGEAIGAVIDGFAPGIDVDSSYIEKLLELRRPDGITSTARIEKDSFKILSGVYNSKTTGTPICIIIENSSQKSDDYSDMKNIARPSHADYSAFCKYHGFEDKNGGGHFSGRITAPIVAAGAIALSALKSKGIKIGTHIKKIGDICDIPFDDYNKDIDYLSDKKFPVLSDKKKKDMIESILLAKKNLDSIGGILETAVTGLPSGIGEPWFDSIESIISHAMFSIPAIKGIEFGDGFAFADMKGSNANDPFFTDGNNIFTLKNSNGGINGGITNGMPLIFSVVLKPTPSIAKKQNTVDYIEMKNTEIEISGRHDPCIAARASIVVKCLTALVLCDILAGRFGTDYFFNR